MARELHIACWAASFNSYCWLLNCRRVRPCRSSPQAEKAKQRVEKEDRRAEEMRSPRTDPSSAAMVRRLQRSRMRQVRQKYRWQGVRREGGWEGGRAVNEKGGGDEGRKKGRKQCMWDQLMRWFGVVQEARRCRGTT